MSIWSDRRRARLKQAPVLDPMEDITIRVAHRICQIVYGGCDCRQRGLSQVCDTMKTAAQQAMQEIIGQ